MATNTITPPKKHYFTQLGRVESADVTSDDHGGWGVRLSFEFGGDGQCFTMRIGKDDARGLVAVLELFDVPKLSRIKGRYVNVLREERYGIIRGLELPECDGGGSLGTCKLWPENAPSMVIT